MKRETKRKVGGFFTAFFTTLLIMSGVLCTVYLLMEGESVPKSEGTTAPNAYLPEAEDRLNILVAGREDASTPPDFFCLLGFLPDQGKIAVCFLPAATYLEDQGQPTTLGDLYEKGGVRYTQKVLAAYLGVPLDHYAQGDVETMDRFLSHRGLMDYYLAVDLRYSLRGREVNMPKGDYQLDGRKAADILQCNEYPGGLVEQSDRGGMLLSQMIQESMPAFLSDSGDRLVTNLLTWLESDIAYTDYEKRRRAMQFLATLKLPVTTTVFLEGTREEDGALHLTDECLYRLRETFATPAGAAEKENSPVSKSDARNFL